MSHQLEICLWLGGELSVVVRQTIDGIKEIDTRGQTLNEYACQECSIEQWAKEFLGTIKSARVEQT